MSQQFLNSITQKHKKKLIRLLSNEHVDQFVLIKVRNYDKSEIDNKNESIAIESSYY